MIDFWILGCQAIPQRAAVSFWNVWSCIMQHIFENSSQLLKILFTDKNGCNTQRGETEEITKISSFLSVQSCRCPYFKGIRHQSSCLFSKHRQRLSQCQESELFHRPWGTPVLARFESMLPFILGNKLIFRDAVIWAWSDVVFISHLSIWKLQLLRMCIERTTQRTGIKFPDSLGESQSGSDGWNSCAEDVCMEKL